MIRIRKPSEPPPILRTKGKNLRRGLSAAYTRNPRAYASGARRFKFDSSVYGDEMVKEALIEAQHGKCCFCEAKILHVSYGDVEHYRPKAGRRQAAGDGLAVPGYYWLAYEWSNLLLACELCNRRHKGSVFPLRNPAHRARCHKDNVDLEEPLFIDPSAVDPEAHISFRQEVPFALGGSPLGKATIRALALQRETLNERRRTVYERLRLLHFLATHEPPCPEAAEARGVLERAVRDDAEYAGMVRAAMAVGFA